MINTSDMIYLMHDWAIKRGLSLSINYRYYEKNNSIITM